MNNVDFVFRALWRNAVKAFGFKSDRNLVPRSVSHRVGSGYEISLTRDRCVVFLGKTVYLHFTVTLPTQEYKWVPEQSIGEYSAMGYGVPSHTGGVATLLVTS